MPSTVVISGVTAPLDEQLIASMVQLRTGTPSTSTVHAPQDESSHPRLEPVNSSSWRSTSKSNSLGSMASSCLRPFTRNSMSSLFIALLLVRCALVKTEQTFVKAIQTEYSLRTRLSTLESSRSLRLRPHESIPCRTALF